MTSKLIPHNPDEVMVIRDVTPGIVTLSLPFLRFGRFKIGGRATVVKLSNNTLAVFSPVALTPSVRSKLDLLSPGSPVAYLIAPDVEHHVYLSAWSTAFPAAKIIGPEGLPEKRATQSKTDKSVLDTPFHTIFTKQNKRDVKIDEAFDADFQYEYVEAHPNRELVFYHKPTSTLIEADLLFNLPATEQYSRTNVSPTTGFASKLFNALMNTKGDAIWQKRMVWYGAKDRAAYAESVKRIDAWDIKNIIPCHGDVIMGNGGEVFKKVFSWFLEGKGQKPTSHPRNE
ncbi:hypothetical protein F5884DRAFT_234356 [Xylogone sp. PMI_703]|nr:hypothetical protein F5884DRAFT_234356 [Xylogone sp. PMI_703]